MKQVMKRAGAGTPSANRITLLRDTDGDGVAESRTVFLEDLNSPFGMALVGRRPLRREHRCAGALPVRGGRDADRGARHEGRRPARRPAQSSLDQERHRQPRRIAPLRHGRLEQQRRRERHGRRKRTAPRSWRSIRRKRHAARSSPPACATRTASAGSRGQASLWTVVNERDELGSDLVPDYLTSVKDGGFYGWPYSYYGQHVDTRVEPPRPDLVAKAIVPDYALGAARGAARARVLRRATCCRGATPAARSSASTAPGTGAR